jgi:hypothetical protein
MNIKVSCFDKYEAKKLAALVYNKESKETFITKILNIFDNELVVSLKDKSAHSVVLKDSRDVEVFADFIQSVLDKEHRIIGMKTIEDEVEIIKE